ncbi:MAG TPA: Ig-like domain-containing protein, partial [Acidobacteriaceae bacterium]
DGSDDVAISSQGWPASSGNGWIAFLLSENQSATATASGIALPPATGVAQVVASYPGDKNYQPSTSAAVALTAAQGSSQGKVTASSNPAPYGTSETLTATVTGSGVIPTGSVTFFDGAGQLGTQSLTKGVATFVTTAFAVGSHSIAVSYGGDSNYTASTSPVLNLVVQKGPPAISITPSFASILSTQALNMQIIVAGTTGNPTPQGSVAASSDTYSSAATTLSNGVATITIPAGSLAVGNDTLTITYTPTAASAGSYTSATQSALVSVIQIGSAAATVGVTPLATEVTDLQDITVHIAVFGAQGMPTARGLVQLTSGAYSAKTELDPNLGVTSFTVPAGSLAQGTDTLTVTYSGDGTYAAATGTATVTVSPVVVAATAPAAIAAGGTATAMVTLTAGSSYSGTLNLSCTLTTSPANAQSPPNCALNPSTATIATGGNATTTLTVKTTAATSAMLMRPNDRLWGRGTEAVAFAALLMISLRARRRRWLSILALFVMAICVVSGGCGGGGSHTTPHTTPGTTAGNYVFTVKAADSKDATIATSANVSVTVQ